MTNPTTGVYNTTWGLTTTGTTTTSLTAPGLVTLASAPASSVHVSGKIRMDGIESDIELNGGKIRMDGPGSDIEVNGVSLMDTLKAIQARLNILYVNKVLEEDWDELKKLGDRYRELEIKLKEKSQMWKSLKSVKK